MQFCHICISFSPSGRRRGRERAFMKKRAVMSALRAAVCAAVFLSLALIPPETLAPHSFCPIFHLTGRRCPGCGMTRAFCCILHGRFADAFGWNPLCTVMFPLCVLLSIDEAATFVSRLCNKNRRSVAERLFGLNM